MEGWKIKEGQYSKNNISEREILDKFYEFRKAKKKTLYKYIFLLVIVEMIERKEEKNFENILRNSIRKYWSYIYLKEDKIMKLSKNRDTSIEKVFMENISDEVALGIALDEIEKKEKIFLECNNILAKYVIGAVYGDFDGEIYSFNIKNRLIQINPVYREVIYRNIAFIKNMLKSELKYEINRLNSK